MASEARSLPGTPVTQPWSRPALITWAALTAVGVVLLGLGWARVGAETVYADQALGIIVAVAGVVVAGVGSILMLLAGRRAIVARRLAVLGDLRGMPVQTAAAAADESTSQGLVAGEGLRHFHRSDCQMAQGRLWSFSTRREHEQAGRVACGVCRP